MGRQEGPCFGAAGWHLLSRGFVAVYGLMFIMLFISWLNLRTLLQLKKSMGGNTFLEDSDRNCRKVRGWQWRFWFRSDGDDPDWNCTGVIVTGVFGRQFSSYSCNNCVGRRKEPEVAKVPVCNWSRNNNHDHNLHSKSMSAIVEETEDGNGKHNTLERMGSKREDREVYSLQYQTRFGIACMLLAPFFRLESMKYNYEYTCTCSVDAAGRDASFTTFGSESGSIAGGNGLEANDLHWETVRKEDVSGRFGFKLLRLWDRHFWLLLFDKLLRFGKASAETIDTFLFCEVGMLDPCV